MNAMGHTLTNLVGADTRKIDRDIARLLPGSMSMGNSGPFGSIDIGGLFTVLKVREDLAAGDERDPGWYRHPPGAVARRVAVDPAFAAAAAQSNAAPAADRQTDQPSR